MKIYYKIYTQVDPTGLWGTPDLIAIGLSAENGMGFYGQAHPGRTKDTAQIVDDFLDEGGIKELIITRKKTKAMMGAEFQVNQSLNEFLEKFESVHLIGSQTYEDIGVLIDALSVKVKSGEVTITNMDPALVEEKQGKLLNVASYLPKTNALKHAIFHQYIFRSNEKKKSRSF